VVLSKRPGRVVHDAPIALPRERTSATRGEPAFAAAASEILRALERGSE
jgi:ABC-type nitrate/sulfonate/bicarbonate transport system ATPase subunit